MQFEDSATFNNLARSFAGESQAGMRYQLAARMATQQGYITLADTIRSIAKNETVHARRFFEELTKRGRQLENIVLDAGYPFRGGTLTECLQFAAEDERAEHERIYPAFADKAEEEGYSDIARLFRLVANVEKRHEMIFKYLSEAFAKGALFCNQSQLVYVCTECGYMQTADRAWDVCPLCNSSQGYVELHIPFGKESL